MSEILTHFLGGGTVKKTRWARLPLVGMLIMAFVAFGAPTATASPDCPTGEIRSGGACAPCVKLKPCYDGPEEMLALTNQIIPLINRFVSASYAQMPAPKAWMVVTSKTATTSACGNLASADTYAYCPTDDTIYLGADQMWMFYSNYSDAAVAIGMAHEYGHHIQMVAGAPKGSSLGKENQADCFAGAWSASMVSSGVMDSVDLSNVSDFIPYIASSEADANRDHGSIQQRIASFNAGFASGLSACNVQGLPPLVS